MKSVLRSALLLPLIAVLAGAAETYRIAVVPKGTTHEFWKSVHAGAMKAQQELKAEGVNVQVIWKGPLREDDREQQVQVIENFTAQRVSGIVVAPLDRRALVAPVEAAVRGKIPVVVIDSGIESKAPASYISTDNREGGRIAAPCRKLDDATAGGGVTAQHLHRQRGLIGGHQVNPITRLEFLGRLGQAEPLPPALGQGRVPLPGLEHEQLHGAATGPARLEAGPQHPGVIHHQQISRLQLLLQVPHAQMAGMGSRAFSGRIHRQQAGGMAGLNGPLGNALIRQVKTVARQPLIS